MAARRRAPVARSDRADLPRAFRPARALSAASLARPALAAARLRAHLRCLRNFLDALLVACEEAKAGCAVQHSEKLAIAHGRKPNPRELHVVDLSNDRIFESQAFCAAESRGLELRQFEGRAIACERALEHSDDLVGLHVRAEIEALGARTTCDRMDRLAILDARVDQQLVDRQSFHGPSLSGSENRRVELIPRSVHLDLKAFADQALTGLDLRHLPRRAARDADSQN